MSPTKRRLALLAARLACGIAPVMVAGFTGVAVAHFFFEVGNYPEPRARYAVGSLFLGLFAPGTGAIWYFARQRVQALAATAPSSEVEKR